MNSPKQLPNKLPIWTDYVNFGPPSLPIYQYLRYFTLNLRFKIKMLRTPITQSRLAANGMPKRLAQAQGRLAAHLIKTIP